MYTLKSRLPRIALIGALAAALSVGSIAVADIISGTPTTGSSTDVTVTQLTLARPSGVSAGTLMLASIAVNGGTAATVSAPSGWSQIIRTDNDVNISLVTYKKVAGASEPSTYTWQVDNQTTMQGGIIPYNGVSVNDPIATSTGTFGNGTTASTGILGVSDASSTLVSVFAVPAGKSGTAGNYFSTPAGGTEKYDTSNTPFGPSIVSFESVQVAPGQADIVTTTINSNKNLNWVSQQIAIRPASPLPQDNFNNSIVGNLEGQNGGSGWTSAWGGSDRFDVTNSVAFEGPNAVHEIQTYGFVEPAISRTFTPRTTGTLHFAMRKDTGDHAPYVALLSGSTPVTYVIIGSDTQPGRYWTLRDGYGTSIPNLAAYTLGTFDTIDMQFDTATDMYRVSVNGGTYSAWVRFVNDANVDYVDTIQLAVGGSGYGGTDIYWDDVRFTQ